jgi:hypothetical protein
MAGTGGLKAAAKRTAFGDVSNTVKSFQPIRDDSGISTKAQIYDTIDKQALLQSHKSSALLRPAQRPLTVSSLKNNDISSTNGTTNAAVTATSAVLQPLIDIQPIVSQANTRKTVIKRSTTIFKDTALAILEAPQPVQTTEQEKVSALPALSTAPVHQKLAPRHHKSQPNIRADQPALRRTKSKFGETFAKVPEVLEIAEIAEVAEVAEVSEAAEVAEVVEISEIVEIAEISEVAKAIETAEVEEDELLATPSFSDEALEEAFAKPSLDTYEYDDEIDAYLRAEAYFSAREAAKQPPPSEPVAENFACGEDKVVIVEEEELQIPVLDEEDAKAAIQADHPLVSEPEEYWEDDEYEEIYDDQGYTTAHSYPSRSDNTTGGATTVLFPKANAKTKKELAVATAFVESTRTKEEIENEAWDTSMVAEYGDEIFSYMRELEVSRCAVVPLQCPGPMLGMHDAVC